MDDKALLSKILSADDEPRQEAELYIRSHWQERVYAIAKKSGGGNEQEFLFELVLQEFLQKAKQKREGILPATGQLSAYFFTIAYYRAKDMTPVKPGPVNAPEPLAYTTEIIFDESLVELFREALLELKSARPLFYSCIYLDTYDPACKTYRDIAAKLNIPENTVAQNIRRGKVYLRENIIKKNPDKYGPLLEFLDED